jgi:copper chaperone CopZ
MDTRLLTTLAVSLLVTLHASEPSQTANRTNQFKVIGMHCDGCAKGITSELKRSPGVVTATVTFSNQLAVVAFDTNHTSSAQLIKVIGEAGYQAQPAQP